MNDKADLGFIYLFLWFIALTNCSGPSTQDFRILTEEVKKNCGKP